MNDKNNKQKLVETLFLIEYVETIKKTTEYTRTKSVIFLSSFERLKCYFILIITLNDLTNLFVVFFVVFV